MDLLGGEKAVARVPRRGKARVSASVPGKRRAGRIAEEAARYGRDRKGSPASRGLGAMPAPLRITAVDHLAERLDLPADILLAIIGVSGRTANRRRQQGVLSGDESDRLYRIARVLQRAYEVFGAEDSALEWFRKPQPFLEYHAPFELLGSDAGTQVVEQELGRIEFGDFS